jgi:hypothetical protein
MIKKYFILIILVQLTLSSCTKVNIITDSYWKNLVSDFQGNAFTLKFQSFLQGSILKFSIISVKEDLSSLTGLGDPESDIYLLSPLLSGRVSEFPQEMSNKKIYFFGSKSVQRNDIKDNMVEITRDRRESFYETGKLLSKILEENYILPVIYSVDNDRDEDEVSKFFDGIDSSGKNIDFLTLEVAEYTAEEEIRLFFDKGLVKKSKYIVFFANKWKNICYDMSERDSKYIITSDSWFVSSYDSLILFSVEDDIKGMLKKVYSNVKNKNFADIILEGVISK